jgi:hypothetical protein
MEEKNKTEQNKSTFTDGLVFMRFGWAAEMTGRWMTGK